jgi:hypothetical protein
MPPLIAAAALAFPQGDYQRPAALASEAMDLARNSEDPMDTRASQQAGRSLTAADAVAYALRQTPDWLAA